MYFALESKNRELYIEYYLWKQLLDDNNVSYVELTYDDVINSSLKSFKNNIIPLGSIAFTNCILQKKYNIHQINPIEIPLCLRTPKFLGRKYNIGSLEQLPSEGIWFIKDASELKKFSYLGNVKDLNREQLISNHKYVVSEPVDILSEYRVYVINGEIYAIEYYNGNPLILPNVNVIQQALWILSLQQNTPNSYTIDVMVTPKGTHLIEVHPVLFSVGLYTTILSKSFLYGYQDSLNYLLKYNTMVEVF